MEGRVAEQLILAFLRARGYRSTEAALKAESRVSAPASSSLGLSLANFFQTFHDARSAESYQEVFESLKGWIESCLDRYRQELEKIMFPVFVHLFLAMIQKGYNSEAKQFFRAYSKMFKHTEDVSQLASIKNRSDFNTEYVENLLQNKFIVQMSRYSVTLLMSFIENSELTLLLSIINQHINILQTSESQGTEPVIIGDDADIINLKPNLYLSSNPEEERPKREAKLPLPTLNPNLINTRFHDLEHKDRLTPENLPNIVCHTLLNIETELLCMDVSEDGSLIAAGCEDSSVRIWNLLQPTIGYRNPVTGKESLSEHIKLVGHTGGVYSVSISIDKNLILSGSEDGDIRLWSTLTRSNLVVFKAHMFPVWSVSFAPMGYYFASGSYDKIAYLWTTDKISPVRMFVGHLSDVIYVRFHPNCYYLATSSADKTIRLWEVVNGNCMRILMGHTNEVSSLGFAKKGRILYSGDASGSIKAWDLTESTIIWTNQLQGAVTAISASQEDEMAAFATEKCELYLVDEKGNLISKYPTKKTPLLMLQFTLRNLLVTGGTFRELE
jgi:transcription initiation factor TFIID subunit 5